MATRDQLHREVDALPAPQVSRARIVVVPEPGEGEVGDGVAARGLGRDADGRADARRGSGRAALARKPLNVLVVDSSLVVELSIDRAGEAACAALDGDGELIAPPLLWSEVPVGASLDGVRP